MTQIFFSAEIQHEEESILDMIIQNEREYLFQKHFLQLKKDCQRVLNMFFEGLSMTEIAKAMGFKGHQYARKRKHYCKKSLLNSRFHSLLCNFLNKMVEK